MNHIIFWESLMRTFRCIYVNCFNRLRCLVAISTKLQRKHFFGQFKVHNSGRKKRKLYNWPHFLNLFFPLWLFVTFIFVFENSQNSFSCGPPFGLFWSVKFLNLGQKIPIRTAHQTFLESKHHGVTKNPYYVLSPDDSQKKVWVHGVSS